MTRLVLIAHAETSAMRRAAFAADEALTPRGLQSARDAAPMRADRGLCSPARAARETAAALGLAASIEPALRDLDAGRWAGSAFADLLAAEPEAAAAFLGDPGYAGHGGEAIVALIDRVVGWLDGLRDERGCLVAVTHASVVRAAVAAALSGPPSAFFRVDVGPLACVTLSCDGRRWSLRAQPLPRGAAAIT